MRKSTLLGVRSIVIAAVIIVVWHWPSLASTPEQHRASLGASAPASQTDEDLVRASVERALQTHQGLEAGPLGASITTDPTAAQLDDQLRSSTAAIAVAFMGDQATHEAAALTNAMSIETSGHFRALGAGIANLNFTQVSITGKIALAKVSVDTWSKMAIKNPDGTWVTAEPHNTLLVTMTLTVDPATGGWKVNGFSLDFSAATAP
jgi:hypothetical protein